MLSFGPAFRSRQHGHAPIVKHPPLHLLRSVRVFTLTRQSINLGVTVVFRSGFLALIVAFSHVCCGWLSSPIVSLRITCPVTSGTSLLLSKGADSCGLKRDFNQTSPSDYFFSFLELSGELCGFSHSKSLSQVNHFRICRISQVFEVVEPRVKREATTRCRRSSLESEVATFQSDGAYRTLCVPVSSVFERLFALCSCAEPVSFRLYPTEQADQPPSPLPQTPKYHNWCRDNLRSRQLVRLRVETNYVVSTVENVGQAYETVFPSPKTGLQLLLILC